MNIRLPEFLVDFIVARFDGRKPNERIGDDNAPYMDRWTLFPKNNFGNVYLHRFYRSDDPRALHDHPWSFVSWVLRGGYCEITFSTSDYEECAYFNYVDSTLRPVGSVNFRRADTPHRVMLRTELVESKGLTGRLIAELKEVQAWTICFVGPRIRDWGFHCRMRWVPWREFTAPTGNGNKVGRGCG